jgi:hypothetical protein
MSRFREMDYSKRHCWGPNKDGNYTIDGTFYPAVICNNWKKHVLKAGPTEFLRWIREFGVLAPKIVTGFDDGWLKLGVQWCDTYKTDMYCEDYGGKVKCFLDVENEVALVEIHDETLREFAEQATILVNQQYEDMC